MQAMYYKRNIKVGSRNQFCRGKAKRITYSECKFVALVIQHLKHMRRIILSPVTCVAVKYFSTLLINGTIFEKKNCFHFLHNSCITFFILSGTERCAYVFV